MIARLSSPDDELVAGARNLGFGPRLHLVDGGVEGWFDPPAPLQEGADLPQAEGSTWPARLSSPARIVTLHLGAICASSVEAAQVADRIAGMFGKRLVLEVVDASGPRSSACYMSDAPGIAFTRYGRHLTADVVLTCPDPLRYGRALTVPLADGAFSGVLGGNAPSFPSFSLPSAAAAAEVSYSGHLVTWEGTGPLSLDLRDLEPSSGAVIEDDAFAIEPGAFVVSCSVEGASSGTMTVRPAWR